MTRRSRTPLLILCPLQFRSLSRLSSTPQQGCARSRARQSLPHCMSAASSAQRRQVTGLSRAHCHDSLSMHSDPACSSRDCSHLRCKCPPLTLLDVFSRCALAKALQELPVCGANCICTAGRSASHACTRRSPSHFGPRCVFTGPCSCLADVWQCM